MRRAVLSVALLVLLLAGCGDSMELIREATFLPAYRYSLTHDADAPGPWLLTAPWGGEPCRFALHFDSPGGLSGRYLADKGVASLHEGSGWALDGCVAAVPFGTLSAEVSAEISWSPAGDFVAGEWVVSTGQAVVTVTIVAGTEPGVELRLDEAAPEFLAWPEFARLFAADSTAPGWQRAASASFEFMRLALSQVEMSYVALVDAADAAFTSVGLVQSCDAFAAAPPAGVLAQGERVMTWLGSADLGFDLRFTDCWHDAPGVDRDYLLRGAVTLSGWRATNDLSLRLVFIGFGGDQSGIRVPGGVGYQQLGLARVAQGAVGGLVIDSAHYYTLGGSFAASFDDRD